MLFFSPKRLDFPADPVIMKVIFEREVFLMDCKIAFFDLKGPSACDAKPLMLHELLFCPVLTWACEELFVRGIQRFFCRL